MNKCTDRDVFRQVEEHEGTGKRQMESYSEFRRKFDEYLRRTGQLRRPKPVGRPYERGFRQPDNSGEF
jgi:hypothetical protein